jgi:hypothetical protein
MIKASPDGEWMMLEFPNGVRFSITTEAAQTLKSELEAQLTTVEARRNSRPLIRPIPTTIAAVLALILVAGFYTLSDRRDHQAGHEPSTRGVFLTAPRTGGS